MPSFPAPPGRTASSASLKYRRRAVLVVSIVFFTLQATSRLSAQAITTVSGFRRASDTDPFAKKGVLDVTSVPVAIAGMSGARATVEAYCFGTNTSPEGHAMNFEVDVTGANLDITTTSYTQTSPNLFGPGTQWTTQDTSIHVKTKFDEEDAAMFTEHAKDSHHVDFNEFDLTKIASARRLLIGLTAGGQNIYLSVNLREDALENVVHQCVDIEADRKKQKEVDDLARYQATTERAREMMANTHNLLDQEFDLLTAYLDLGTVPTAAIFLPSAAGNGKGGGMHVALTRDVRGYINDNNTVKNDFNQQDTIDKAIRSPVVTSSLKENGIVPAGSKCTVLGSNFPAKMLSGQKYVQANCTIYATGDQAGKPEVNHRCFIPVDGLAYDTDWKNTAPGSSPTIGSLPSADAASNAINMAGASPTPPNFRGPTAAPNSTAIQNDLVAASASGDLAKVQMLLANGASPDVSDDRGETALEGAAENGRLEVAKALVAKGASLNGTESDDPTPLLVATFFNKPEMLRWLLDAGADVNKPGMQQTTPLMAAVMGKNQAILRLLIDKGANVNSKGIGGITPLMVASQQGDEEIVKILLAKGAAVNAVTDESAVTALSAATKAGHEDVRKLLLSAGAK